MPTRLANISRAVRERRKSLRLSQQELADLAACSTRFIHALEHGKQTVRLDKLLDVLEVLGMELTTTVRRT